MNVSIKKIGFVIAAFAGSFLLLAAIAYFLYPMIEPEAAEQVDQEIAESARVNNLPEGVSTAGLESDGLLTADMDSDIGASIPDGSPQSILALRFEEKEASYLKTIDSLKTVITDMQSSFEEQLAAKVEQDHSEEILSVTKSLMSLDVEELSPILNRLQDSELIRVYRTASNMQREKLLRALEPQKASKIILEVLS